MNLAAGFAIAIFVSFIPDAFPQFFGDWMCSGNNYTERLCQYRVDNHDPHTWHWGFRHWLFMLMGLVLFILNAFRAFTLFENDETK